MNQPDDQKQGNSPYVLNMTIAGVVGQVGCLTLVVIFVALFAGLWLDKLFDTKPVFTLMLMLGSVPLTLYLMFRLVKMATSKIKPMQTHSSQEDPNRGTED